MGVSTGATNNAENEVELEGHEGLRIDREERGIPTLETAGIRSITFGKSERRSENRLLRMRPGDHGNTKPRFDKWFV
jgi:hypothetical protein